MVEVEANLRSLGSDLALADLASLLCLFASALLIYWLGSWAWRGEFQNVT